MLYFALGFISALLVSLLTHLYVSKATFHADKGENPYTGFTEPHSEPQRPPSKMEAVVIDDFEEIDQVVQGMVEEEG
jgi:hypothetical protein